MLTIAIVENNRLHATQIEIAVKRMHHCKVQTVCADGFEFIRYCSSSKALPAMVLVDVEMNLMDGVALTDHLTNYFPSIKVIALTSHCNRETVEDMIACGAMGYVFKLFIADKHKIKVLQPDNFIHLYEAIDCVAKGGYYIDALITEGFANNNIPINPLQLAAKRREELIAAKKLGLTEKEQMVGKLYATSTIKQTDIADTLAMANKTIDAHIQSASLKLKVRSRQAFALRSLAIGLVKTARGLIGIEETG